MKHTALAITTTVAAAASASASVTVFTDRAAWEAAVTAPTSTETFNSVPLQDFSGSSVTTPLLTVTEIPNPADDSNASIVDGATSGDLDGTNFIDVDTGTTPGNVLAFNAFAGGSVFAWGADFGDPFSGPGVDIVAGENRIPTDSIVGFSQGFIGFVASGETFSEISIEFNGSGAGVLELYSIDNVSFAIPAPASAALLGAAGLAATRRRR